VPGHPPSAIHPTAVIGPDVKIGEGVLVGPHAALVGPMVVGDRVVISAGATLGGPPEVTGFPQRGEEPSARGSYGVVLESDVVVREQVVVHQGTERATTVSAGTWLLNRSYVAHDVRLGRDCVVSAGVSLGGHCTVGDLVTIGMNAAVHQRRHIGRGAMIGMGAVVAHDVPPWAKAYGVPARLRGTNQKAMHRAALRPETIDAIARAYAEGETDLADPPADVRDDYLFWRAVTGRTPPPREAVR
jgi:UDP-N-acetylglucosamine acyltransferase